MIYIEINNERLDVLERIIVTKNMVIEHIPENLKKVTEKIDTIKMLNEDKRKTMKVNMRKHYEGFTEEWLSKSKRSPMDKVSRMPKSCVL